MALYPNVAWTYTDRTDGVDAVVAADVNSVYHEVTALENTVGLTPSVSGTWSGTFNQSSGHDFSTVTLRIANIENGLSTAYNSRVSTAGGSTIASSSTTVGLTLSTSGTGNLFVAGNTTINSSGNIVLIDGGTA